MHLLLAVLLSPVMAAATAAAAPVLTSLPPFSSVHVCLPFSVLIRPSGAGEPLYGLVTDGVDAGAVRPSVENGALSLTLERPLNSSACIAATVALPANALREVHVLATSNRSNGAEQSTSRAGTPITVEVADAEGFRVPSLAASLRSAAQGDPRILIRNITTNQLTLAAYRCRCTATALVSGTIRQASVFSDFQICPEPRLVTDGYYCAVPSVVVDGITERANVNGSVALISPNASLAIEGVAADLVTANQGRCNLHLLVREPGVLPAVSPLPCNITGAITTTAELAESLASAKLEPTCGFETADDSECAGGLQLGTGAEDGVLAWARAAEAPLPGPTAEQRLNDTLAAMSALAQQARSGNASAPAAITNFLIGTADEDLMALLTVIVLKEGGRPGSLAAAESTTAGLGTRFGPRDSFNRALAVLVNENDTEALRTALEAGTEWEHANPQTNYLSDPAMWEAGTVRGVCTRGKLCIINYGGVQTEYATAMLLSASLALAGGHFANASTEVLATPSCPNCKLGLQTAPPPLSCGQLRRALAEAQRLAPQLGFGRGEQVLAAARSAPSSAWRSCILGPNKVPGAMMSGADDSG